MVNDPKDDENIENKEESSEISDSDDQETPALAEEDSGESDEQDVPSEDDAAEGAKPSDDIEDAVIVDEGDVEPSSEDVQLPEPTAAPASPRDTTGSSVFAMFAGGLIAGGIGFLVATYAVPEGWPNSASNDGSAIAEELAATSQALAAQTERLDALQSELENTAAPEPAAFDSGPLDAAINAVTADLGALGERLDGLTGTLDALGVRVEALEERPVATLPDGSDAMAAQMQSFQADLEAVTDTARSEIAAVQEAARNQISAAQAELAAVQDRAAEIEAEAQRSAEAAQRAAAVAQIQAALDNGTSFTDELSMLETVPDALAAVADSGAPTLSALKAEFPASARNALSSAQATPEDAGAGDKLAAFLRRQTNARSLSPREGDGVDAVLSRAEAALSAGDLKSALAEIEALPDEPKSALAGWVDTATARLNAVEAVETLSAEAN